MAVVTTWYELDAFAGAVGVVPIDVGAQVESKLTWVVDWASMEIVPGVSGTVFFESWAM